MDNNYMNYMIDDLRVNLFKNIQNTNQDKIKSLNQKERTDIVISLKLLVNNESLSSLNFNKTQIDNVISKLNRDDPSVLHLKSNIFMRIIKGIFNKLKLTISSISILSEIKSNSKFITNELEEIPKKIKKKEQYLQEWNDYIDFYPKATVHYQKMKEFCEGLSEDVHEAEVKLENRIKEIEENELPKIIKEFKLEFKAKNERDPAENEIKGGLVKVLRDEILVSLKNMHDYYSKNEKKMTNDCVIDHNKIITEIKDGFIKEIKTQRKAWENTVQNINDSNTKKLANEEVLNLKKEIEELNQRKNNLTQ